MLLQRIATAAVGLPALVALVLVGGIPFAAIVALALAVATAEFYHTAGLGWTPGTAIGVVLSAAAAFAAHAGHGWPAATAAAIVILAFLWPIVTGRTATALHDWAIVAGGAIYVGWLGSHGVLLRELDHGRDWLLLVLFAVFATDTGAYFVGRAVGRRRMAPAISPGKTWEGAIGGLIAGLLTVVALHTAFDLDASTFEITVLAIAIPIVAQIGDLAESVLKRSMGVKDMGWLLPGHGGVVDRLDSLLFVLPVVYYWIRWVVM